MAEDRQEKSQKRADGLFGQIAVTQAMLPLVRGARSTGCPR